MKKFSKPYRKGYLDVGEGHSLYYECCGNQKGLPVLFLHGGPGYGFGSRSKDFFELNKCNLVLFDQRGAGRSKPFASTQANTTGRLVKDINKLLDFLNFKKVFLFGGSWGSTLALMYAIKNPKRVMGMLLRGIYTATKKENDFYVNDVKLFFPEDYPRFISLVPQKYRGNPLKYYTKRMANGSKKIRQKYAFAWARYEHSILKLVPEDIKKIEEETKKSNYLSLGVLETYYLSNGCFIPNDYIIKNAGKIKVPVSIVQGRYDMVCPPITAWKIHRAIKNSRLQLTISGHSSSDPETSQALRKEMKRFCNLYQKKKQLK